MFWTVFLWSYHNLNHEQRLWLCNNRKQFLPELMIEPQNFVMKITIFVLYLYKICTYCIPMLFALYLYCICNVFVSWLNQVFYASQSWQYEPKNNLKPAYCRTQPLRLLFAPIFCYLFSVHNPEHSTIYTVLLFIWDDPHNNPGLLLIATVFLAVPVFCSLLL